MVFSSIIFIFYYLPAVLAVYYFVPARFRNLWLFAVNLVFYAWGEPVYILIMLFSITVDYINGRLIGKYRLAKPKLAKGILIWDMVVNLSLLAVFKYSNLLVGTVNSLLGTSFPLPNLALPIGISFYTFQTMSYPIDVYRGNTQVQKNYITFGTFVALFPQLIAGPIVRYKDIAQQLEHRTLETDKLASGVRRFVIGLGKKALIANNVGALWDIYAAAAGRTVLGSWLGAAAFSLQLYFDFSGYSDMAIGLGRMLGFEFVENFNFPYIAKSVTEFWRRWHITLGTWFRDYLYIPLGGNRRGLPRQLFNILVVWALTGFWHGANWTFLLWGLYYALFLILEKMFLLKPLEKSRVLGHVYTLLVAVFGWMLFQLDSVGEAMRYWGAMTGLRSSGLSSAHDLFLLRSYGPTLLLAMVLATPLARRLWDKVPEKARAVLEPVGTAAVFLLCTAYLVDASYNPFLYFRF